MPVNSKFRLEESDTSASVQISLALLSRMRDSRGHFSNEDLTTADVFLRSIIDWMTLPVVVLSSVAATFLSRFSYTRCAQVSLSSKQHVQQFLFPSRKWILVYLVTLRCLRDGDRLVLTVHRALLTAFSSTLKTVEIGRPMGMCWTNETFARTSSEFRGKKKCVFRVGTAHRMILFSALLTITDLTLLADRCNGLFFG